MRTVAELGNLRGRVALVTGGAGHLGLAFGEALIENGAQVVVVDRDAASCQERAQALSRSAANSLAIVCDLSSREETESLVSRVLERIGRLDILINNAAWTGATDAGGWGVPFDQQSLEA